MLYLYGYKTGCSACDKLKELFDKHRIEYQFVEVQRGQHPFETVPQTIMGSQLCGGYADWRKHLEG